VAAGPVRQPDEHGHYQRGLQRVTDMDEVQGERVALVQHRPQDGHRLEAEPDQECLDDPESPEEPMNGPLLLPTWTDLGLASPALVATMRRYLEQIGCVLRPGSVSGATSRCAASPRS